MYEDMTLLATRNIAGLYRQHACEVLGEHPKTKLKITLVFVTF